MANQRNYVTDIANTTLEYTKFSVSRIVDNPLSSIIEVEVPTTIPETFVVEVSMYSLYDNVLIYNTTLTDTDDIFTLQTFDYGAPNGVRNLLFFDLSKTDIQQIYGRFQIVFSFLVPTIGDVQTTPLMITNISPSRTELQLQLKPEYKTASSASYLRNYVSPQIPSQSVGGVLRQIFNQPTMSNDSGIPTDSTKITYNIIKSYFSPQTTTLVNNATNGIEALTTVKIQEILNIAYSRANTIAPINKQNISYFTNNELTYIVSSSLSYALGQINTTGVKLV